MATSETPTLLSLDRFARVLGINPMRFNQGAAGELFSTGNQCSDLWYQRSYLYSQAIGREELARAILTAEQDIADYLGYWIAPKFISLDVVQMPRYHRRDELGGYDTPRGYGHGIQATFAKVISPGRREIAAVEDDLAIAYSDDDGDGFDEIATITATTALTDAREIKVFRAGYNGDPSREIRDAISKEISGGTFTAVYYTWQFVKENLLSAFPSGSPSEAIDLTEAANLCDVDDIEVYREYCDTTAVSAEFLWEPEPLSTAGIMPISSSPYLAGEFEAQSGVFHTRDANLGFVVPLPATYSDDDGQWNQDCYSIQRPPDIVRLWYKAGEISNAYLSCSDSSAPLRRQLDPLSDYWAETIAFLAIARIERPICSCGIITALVTQMQNDLARAVGDSSYQITPKKADCPFGTRQGEILAWERCRNFRTGRVKGGSV